MFSLKAFLFVSVLGLAQLAVASPIDKQVDQPLICAVAGTRGDPTNPKDLCTVSRCNPSLPYPSPKTL
ncbi:hypothetical protein PpBr36_03975 [Pyricularia pennisetigena]|uniref:hypothetical protein n=1 Tax=Pyricularia pennisetigena TaxID=1578925 RepID=UPI00114E9967|nr:hypothetical protein PpBr36_03975 [Pyricularia pennisetigena]TLS26924.1 hypothetical protein PpBr36_03975 [Pyricularia pennisetigena]